MYRVVVRLVIPESPRWLAVHARYDEVTALLQKMCRANKRQLPPDLNPKCLVDELNEVQYENFPLIIHNICKKLISLKHCVRSQITRLKQQKSFCDLQHGASL